MRPVIDVRVMGHFGRIATAHADAGRWHAQCMVGVCAVKFADVNLGLVVLDVINHAQEVHPYVARSSRPYEAPEGEAKGEQ